MKKIFTFAIALMSFIAITSATNLVFKVTVPTPTNECWIIGNFCNWTLTSAVQCTKVDDTHYTVTLDDTTFPSGTTAATLQYKYLSGNGDWSYNEVQADGSNLPGNGNRNGFNPDAVTGFEMDVVAKWNVLFVPHTPVPMNVTIDVLVPAGTFQCYIVGNFNSWAGPTAPADSCKMVLVSTNTDGTKIFEKTVFTADELLLAYHFCSGPDWSFEQSAPSGDYHYPEVQPVVTSWKAVFDPSTVGNINIVATVPLYGTGNHVYIQGGFNGWSWSSPKEMTKNADGTYSYLINNIASTEYKIYNGTDWGYVEVDATGTEVANRSVTAVPQSTITENITVIGWKTPTALKELNADNYKVYTQGHSIVVEGVTSQVEVYDASGRTMQSVKTMGTFTSRNLNAGLYILKVDGATRKVALN
jgi:hypothetical protein